MYGLDGMMQAIGGKAILMTAIPLVLVGLLFVWRWLAARRRVKASMNWERTTGTVLMSMVETRRSRSGRSGYSTSYYPKVVYQYSVMGQQFTGDRFNLGEVGLGFYNRVAAKVAEYPQGKTIDVYYNPANPVEAVLERTAPSGTAMLFALGIVAVILIFTVGIMFGGFAMAGQFVNNMLNMIPATPTPR